MLKEHYGASSFAHLHDSPTLVDDALNSNHSLPHYDWQTLLSYDHWPTLFSFYNISYDNRYLTIMPSIYLPTIASEDQQLDLTTRTAHRPLLDATKASPSSSLIDGRFSTALWELLFIVLFGFTLFGIAYFRFFSSTSSSPASHPRTYSCTRSDHSIVPTILTPQSATVLIESISVHETGTVVSVAYSDGSICLWNPQTGGLLLQQRRVSSTPPDKLVNHVWCSLMLDEHRCLLGCSDGQIEAYPHPTGAKNIVVHHAEVGGITHLVRASGVVIVGATRRGYLLAFEHLNGSIKELYIKRIHQWPIRVCQVDLSSALIFTGSDDHSIKVTNVANGSTLHTLHKHQAPVNCLAVDPVGVAIVTRRAAHAFV